MGTLINFYDPVKSKKFRELRDKASQELGRQATIRDLIDLGFVKRVEL